MNDIAPWDHDLDPQVEARFTAAHETFLYGNPEHEGAV
jgi:hypothetical protein